MSRIEKVDWYFEIVRVVGLRSTCDRGRNAAVLVRNGRVLATGYAGAPAGAPHCDDAGHELEETYHPVLTGDVNRLASSIHCVRTVHAEVNALLQAAKYGPPVAGATMFCSAFPCYACAKAIVNAGVTHVYAAADYQRSRRSKELFDLVGVRWEIRDDAKTNPDEG